MLLQHVLGWEFRRAAEEVERVVGDAKPIAVKEERKETPEQITARLTRVWERASPLRAGDPVLQYLAGRGIKPTIWRDIKADGDYMLAAYRAPSGEIATLHRTAVVGEKKRILASGAPVTPGGAVRLSRHEGKLGVAEGLETSMAAMQIHGIPCWSCLTADALAKWEPPNNVKEIVIFGDNDKHYVGQASAYLLARRLASRQKDGKRLYSIKVMIPDSHKDWNDVLKQAR